MATALEIGRADTAFILDTDGEMGTEVTYIRNTPIYDDDNSIKSNEELSKNINVSFQPEGDGDLKIGDMGQAIVGKAEVFFKYQYEFTDLILVPKQDDKILNLGTLYRITKLNPIIVNGGVTHYEGLVVREDLV